MIVVLLGPPGCGKGTISSFLSKKYNFFHVSTGDLIRNEINEGTDLAREINNYVSEGKLVPDELTNELLKKKVLKEVQSGKNIVLDGYPRNISQAHFLDTILNVDSVLNVVVDTKVIVKRIIGRRICQKCGAIYNIYFTQPKQEGKCDLDGSPLFQRTDDNEETIKKRITVFKENNEEIFKYYSSKKILHDIENGESIEEVESQIKTILKLK